MRACGEGWRPAGGGETAWPWPGAALGQGRPQHRKCSPLEAVPGVRDHAAEHGPGPHGITGTPPPWPGPPEASGDHIVGASWQPPVQRGLVFFGFLRSLGFCCAGETLDLGLYHPAGPVVGIC